MANSTLEQANALIELMRNSYISVAHFLIHIAIAVVPVFILLLPQYSKSGEAFHLIALTVVLFLFIFFFVFIIIKADVIDIINSKLSHLQLAIDVLFIALWLLLIPLGLHLFKKRQKY